MLSVLNRSLFTTLPRLKFDGCLSLFPVATLASLGFSEQNSRIWTRWQSFGEMSAIPSRVRNSLCMTAIVKIMRILLWLSFSASTCACRSESWGGNSVGHFAAPWDRGWSQRISFERLNEVDGGLTRRIRSVWNRIGLKLRTRGVDAIRPQNTDNFPDHRMSFLSWEK